MDPGGHASGPETRRRRPALAAAPFIALGLADVIVLLVGGSTRWGDS